MSNDGRLARQRRTLEQAKAAEMLIGMIEKIVGRFLRRIPDEDQGSPVRSERLFLQAGGA
jgi:hypothetical protein